MNRVLIKLPGYDRYAIRYLRNRDVDILNVSKCSDGNNIYTIWTCDLEKLDEDVIVILSYKGMRRIWEWSKKNISFLGGIILSLLVMFFLSHVVVEVEVIHSNKDVRVLIEDELYDHGVRPFMLKKSFKELQEIKAIIKSEHPEELEWLEINDDGMKYTVRVEERIITRPEEEPEYCNIVSTKDAIVLGTVAKLGQSLVNTNDFVKKGSVLISGNITYNEEVKAHVCAEGVVYGNAWYRVVISVPLEHEEKNYTGEEKYNLGFERGSTYNRIFKVHFDDYDVEKKKLFSLGGVTLYKEKVREYNPSIKTYEKEEAIEEALKQAREKMLVKLPEDSVILSEKVLQSDTYDSIINVEIFYSVKEVISMRVEEEYVPSPDENAEGGTPEQAE